MPSKLIGLTGDTAGIGLAIRRELEDSGHKVLGFSRSNGFDLSKQGTLPRIIEAVSDCDVFINNAAFAWQQIELLFGLFEKWQPHERLIINIGSNSSDQKKESAHPYAIIKGALDSATLQLAYLKESRCRVTNLRPGWTNTKGIEGLKGDEPLLEPKEVAKVVAWIISSPEHIKIPSLTMVAHDFKKP